MLRFTVDNRNRLVFYGNMVGYVKDNTAVVDEMFQTDELEKYLSRLNLTPQWEEGIFGRLSVGDVSSEELDQPRKGCRIWQLKKNVDVTMRFIGYEDLVKKFGEPDVILLPGFFAVHVEQSASHSATILSSRRICANLCRYRKRPPTRSSTVT